MNWIVLVSLIDALLSCHSAATGHYDRAAWQAALACFGLLWEARVFRTKGGIK